MSTNTSDYIYNNIWAYVDKHQGLSLSIIETLHVEKYWRLPQLIIIKNIARQTPEIPSISKYVVKQ